MSTLTPNYSWILPGVNDPTDQDLWGSYLNSNLTAQDTLVKSISDQADLASPATLAKSSNYTVLAADQNALILVDATGGAVTITLPLANTADGFRVSIKKIDASTNSVIVDGNGAETIDGEANITYTAQYDAQTYVSNGTAWSIESEYGVEGGAIGDATSVYQTTGTSLPDSANTLITFDTELYDELGIHSTSVNPGRFTFTSAMRVLVEVRVDFGTFANSDYTIILNKNTSMFGSNNWIFKGSSGQFPSKLTFSDIVDVVDTDYLEVYVWKTGSGATTTGTGTSGTTVKILRVK